MEDTLTNVFNEVMNREGRTLTTYTNKAEFKAFFRKRADEKSSQDTIIMFYGKAAPVKQGTLFLLDNEIYIALNHEHVEGSVYWKSTIEKVNGILTLNNLSVVDIPIFGETMKSALALENTYFSVIDGYTAFITEDNEKARKLKVDDTFNEWGRTWKIKQIYFRDGICYITVNVVVNEPVLYDYRLELNELSILNVAPGDTAKIMATAYINDIQFMDAEIIYSSSDSALATIDTEGNIEYLADGEVYFMATWAGHEDLAKTTATVSIVSEPINEAIELHVDKVPEIYNGFEEEINYYVTKGGVKVADIPIVFTIENVSTTAVYAKNIKIESQTDSVVVVLADDSRLIGKTFELVGKNAEFELENRQTITIKSMF